MALSRERRSLVGGPRIRFRSGKATFAFATAILAAACALPGDPRPRSPVTRPARKELELPAFTEPYRTSRLTRLAAVLGRPAWRHDGPVRAVAVSPAGVAVSGGDDGVVLARDLAAGTERGRLAGHKGSVRAVAVSPDGRRALSGSWDRTVRLWDVLDRSASATFEGHEQEVTAVAFVGEARALSGSLSGELKLWDLERGREVRTLAGVHPHGVSALGVAATTAISGGFDGTLGLWDLAAPSPVRALESAHGAIGCLALSPDARRALTGHADGTTVLWDLEAGREVSSLPGSAGAVAALAFSSDGRRFLTATSARVLVRAAEGGELLVTLALPAPLHAAAFSPDGARVLAAGDDGVVRVLDLATRREVAPGHGGAVSALALSSNGRVALSGSADRTLRLWEARTGRPLDTLDLGATARGVAFAPEDDRSALVATDDGVLRLLRVDPERRSEGEGPAGLEVVARREEPLAARLAGLIASPRGGSFVLSAIDSVEDVVTIDATTLERGREVRGRRRASPARPATGWSLALAPDGRRAVLGCEGFLSLVGLELERPLGDVGRGEAPLDAVALSNRGTLALAGGRDGLLHLFDLAAEKELLAFAGHGGGIVAVGFLEDARTVVSASRDGTIRLWDLTTGDELDRIELDATAGAPSRAILGSSGRTILVGTDRGLVLQFELSRGR